VNQQLAHERERTKKYRENVRKRSKQASTKVNAFLGKDTDIKKIKDFGEELKELLQSLKNPEDLTLLAAKYAAFDVIKHAKMKVDNLAKKVGLPTITPEQIAIFRKNLHKLPFRPPPDFDYNIVLRDEDADKNEKQQTQQTQTQSDNNNQKFNTEQKTYSSHKNKIGINMKSNLKEDVMPPEMDQFFSDLLNYWKENNYTFKKFDEKIPDELQLKVIAEIIDNYFKSGMSYEDLPKHINNTIYSQITHTISTRYKNYLDQPTNPIDRELEELEESLDRIIGKDVATWIKR
jgi:hypothetical protein